MKLKTCTCGGKAKTHCERVAEDSEACWVECESCGRKTEATEDAYCDFDTAEWLWNEGKAERSVITSGLVNRRKP